MSSLSNRHRRPRHRRRAASSSCWPSNGRLLSLRGRAAARGRRRQRARPQAETRGIDLARVRWDERPAWRWPTDPDVDVVVELIGGAERRGARAGARRRCARGKHVVTANKALLAHHGAELAPPGREASGVHRSASRRRSPAASRSSRRCARAWPATGSRRVYGILNGTCNYILTDDARDRPRLRRRARRGAGGWAMPRPIPSFDVDGIDAAHKLAILAGARLRRPARLRRRAHRGHPPRLARSTSRSPSELGYRIKLLGRGARDRARPRAARASLHGAGWPRRSRRSRACSTPWWPRATSSARRCSRAAAPGRGRPPRPWSPTSSTSPRGRSMPAFGVPAARAGRHAGRADGAPRRRLLHPPDGGRPAGRDRRRRRRACATTRSRSSR